MKEETKFIAVQLAGLNCWKCHKATGALAIPTDQEPTPETLAAYLISHKILPICDSCIKANPRRTSFENLER